VSGRGSAMCGDSARFAGGDEFRGAGGAGDEAARDACIAGAGVKRVVGVERHARGVGDKGFEVLEVPRFACDGAVAAVGEAAAVAVDEDARGEAVAHAFFLAGAATGGVDEMVVELVEVDEENELFGVTELEDVGLAPPVGRAAAGAGDVGVEVVGVSVVSADVDQQAGVGVLAGTREVGAAAVADADSEVVVPVRRSMPEQHRQEAMTVECGGVAKVHDCGLSALVTPAQLKAARAATQ
jgi:hypothetical protein